MLQDVLGPLLGFIAQRSPRVLAVAIHGRLRPMTRDRRAHVRRHRDPHISHGVSLSLPVHLAPAGDGESRRPMVTPAASRAHSLWVSLRELSSRHFILSLTALGGWLLLGGAGAVQAWDGSAPVSGPPLLWLAGAAGLGLWLARRPLGRALSAVRSRVWQRWRSRLPSRVGEPELQHATTDLPEPSTGGDAARLESEMRGSQALGISG